jgi:hypothetical protein|tara:strand:+ start:1837 stop:2709 length:873 start_codon:yes stop_codon:yes gene_type:complete
MESSSEFLENATVNETKNINEKIEQFVNEKKPVVYILTPCYGSVCYVNYVYSLMMTLEMFRQYKITANVEFCKSDSLVTRARNNLIAKAMNDPNMTHILFIDNDISWEPFDILKLLLHDKNIVGGIYPLKNYHWNKLLENNGESVKNMIEKKNKSQLSDFINDENMIQYNLLNYNINYKSNEIKIEKNLTEVKHIPTGFMLLKRSVIEKMQEAYPSTKYTDDVHFLTEEENKYCYALFDCGVEDKHYFSEDWMFCHRWSKMGGKLWIDISINLTHTGIEDYRGSLLSSLL